MSELAQASGTSYGLNLNYTLVPGARTLRIAGANVRINPSGLSLRSGFVGSDAERFQVGDRRAQTFLALIAEVIVGDGQRALRAIDPQPVEDLREIVANLGLARAFADRRARAGAGLCVRDPVGAIPPD